MRLRQAGPAAGDDLMSELAGNVLVLAASGRAFHALHIASILHWLGQLDEATTKQLAR